jgi:hypothetical protein
MKRRMLIVAFSIWVVVELPAFGLIPLLNFVFDLRINHELVWLDWALLRDFFSLFFIAPYPNVSDVTPPLTKIGWATMIITSLGITALLVRGLWLSRRGLK